MCSTTKPKRAEASEKQAEAYRLLAAAALNLITEALDRGPVDAVTMETLEHEAERLAELADEFARDAEPDYFTYAPNGDRVPVWTR